MSLNQSHIIYTKLCVNSSYYEGPYCFNLKTRRSNKSLNILTRQQFDKLLCIYKYWGFINIHGQNYDTYIITAYILTLIQSKENFNYCNVKQELINVLGEDYYQNDKLILRHNAYKHLKNHPDYLNNIFSTSDIINFLKKNGYTIYYDISWIGF